MTPSEAPKALQASECSELLDPTRANCWISAQHQPGKFIKPLQMSSIPLLSRFTLHRPSMKSAISACTALTLPVHACSMGMVILNQKVEKVCMCVCMCFHAAAHSHTHTSTSAAAYHCGNGWDKSPTKIQRFTLMCPIHGNL